uniref:Uncharacterized protein n=1 Tax=Setaria viridis TaxID=4556 RepID=A0A4U6VJU0_SETVI|nr:hypothetical protein SEVIR_3G354300v2 [Setaria viridis]
MVDSLFCSPPQPVMQAPAEQHASAPAPAPARRRTRQRRVFDMSSIRCSLRLSTAHPMTPMQRAQRNLCRKLGLLGDVLDPVEAALQEFLAMFTGPLLDNIIAAMTEIFNIDNDEADELDKALIAMVGEGIDELPGEAPVAQVAA